MQNNVRIAVEGCGHGTLNAIYDAVEQNAAKRGWDGVDLVIICGDFQAARNTQDLNAMSVPMKYREMGDYHEYYSGKREAPYLTVFLGGNHEASSHLFELYYGGWVAPNIYYLGAANVVRLGGLRIAGLSGIWKGFDFKKPHHERPPYSADDIKSLYHVRELDLRKLMQIQTQVDIGLSHDWPRKIEYSGNHRQLFSFKPYFKEDSKNGVLGSVAAGYMLHRLRPPYWFSGHMHCRFEATVSHRDPPSTAVAVASLPVSTSSGTAPVGDQHKPALESSDGANPSSAAANNPDEIDLDDDDVEPLIKSSPKPDPGRANPDEIDVDMEEVEDATEPEAAPHSTGTAASQSAVPDSLRAQLPASFNRPSSSQTGPNRHQSSASPSLNQNPVPHGITNKTTSFLALDKLLPGRSFLELLELPSPHASASAPLQRPFKLCYDAEWLAITRALASELQLTSRATPQPIVPPDLGPAAYLPRIRDAERWVQQHVVDAGRLQVPDNFAPVAPVHDPAQGTSVPGMPREYPNPQTAAFCELVGIENRFAIAEEEIEERMANAPAVEQEGGGRGRWRGGGRGRGWRGGRGRGGGRGRAVYRVQKR